MDTVKISNRGSTKIIAHRGCSRLERENSAAAFIAAGNRSYWGIESDVHLTADGKFVIIHDSTTGRVSGVDIPVENSDFDRLREIPLTDLDGRTDRSYLRIPSLEEYIAICKKYEKKAVLEIKHRFPDEKLREMAESIRRQGHLEDTVFISFNLDNLLYLRKLLPEQKIQFLCSTRSDALKALTQNKEAEFAPEIRSAALAEALKDKGLDLDIYYHAVSKELADALHAQGLEINAWTVDKEEKIQEMLAAGVDYITTERFE